MEMSKQEYQKFVQARAKSSPIVKDCALAFVIGGGICVVGQLIMDGFTALGLEQVDAGTATSISMVFLSALLTGLNLYNKLARYGGAGSCGQQRIGLIRPYCTTDRGRLSRVFQKGGGPSDRRPLFQTAGIRAVQGVTAA